MTEATLGTFEKSGEAGETFRRGCGKAKARWSFLEVAAMVGGFVIFWPLGLVALFLKWKNGEMWPGAAGGTSTGTWKMPNVSKWQDKWQDMNSGYSPSGNAAFDEYKRTQLARLEEERRKLDEEQKAFREHLWNLRRARDKEEFDKFMAARNAKPSPDQTTS